MSALNTLNVPSHFLRGRGLLVLWGSVDRTAVEEEPLNDWWTNEHLPERLSVSGFARARRYYASNSSSTSMSNYLTLYEVASLDILTSPDYMAKLNAPTPATQKWLPTLASMDRSACSVLYSVPRNEFKMQSNGVGGTIAQIVCTPPSDAEKRRQALGWISEHLAPVFMSDYKTVLAVHLVEQDDEATRSGSSSKSYDAVRLSGNDADAASGGHGRWIFLVEFAAAYSSPMAEKDRQVVHKLVETLRQGATHSFREIWWEIYQLICAVSL